MSPQLERKAGAAGGQTENLETQNTAGRRGPQEWLKGEKQTKKICTNGLSPSHLWQERRRLMIPRPKNIEKLHCKSVPKSSQNCSTNNPGLNMSNSKMPCRDLQRRRQMMEHRACAASMMRGDNFCLKSSAASEANVSHSGFMDEHDNHNIVK